MCLATPGARASWAVARTPSVWRGGTAGTADFMPIHFINKSVNFEELCAIYAAADVCLVTSTRDGMNLVSYEYVACQDGNHGVLVLSEFAGAAQSLYGPPPARRPRPRGPAWLTRPSGSRCAPPPHPHGCARGPR